MNLLKVHVLEKEDLEILIQDGECTSIEDIVCENTDFEWDYHQMALINEDTGERLIWNDNVHTNIEEDIKNIIHGMRIAGANVNIREIAMMYDTVLEKFTGAKYR